MVTADPGATPPLRDTPESWPLVGTEDLHRDDWVMALRRDEIRAPGGGETFARLVLEHGWAVGVTSQGHKAIENLLRAVVTAGVPPEQVGKSSRDPEGASWTPLARADDLAIVTLSSEETWRDGVATSGDPTRRPLHWFGERAAARYQRWSRPR